MNQICVLDDLCVLLIEKALESEISLLHHYYLLTSLSMFGVVYSMKGHPGDEFAKRGGSLTKKVYVAPFFLFFYVDVCQRTHAELSTFCRYSFFVANYGGMMKVLSLHILMFETLLEGCDIFQVMICKGIEL